MILQFISYEDMVVCVKLWNNNLSYRRAYRFTEVGLHVL